MKKTKMVNAIFATQKLLSHLVVHNRFGNYNYQALTNFTQIKSIEVLPSKVFSPVSYVIGVRKFHTCNHNGMVYQTPKLFDLKSHIFSTRLFSTKNDSTSYETHKYRTHNCNELGLINVDQEVKLSGWVHRLRNIGNDLLFVIMRDHFGMTQLIFNNHNQKLLESVKLLNDESVITVTGKVLSRNSKDFNNSMATGKIEVLVDTLNIESKADLLPFPVSFHQEVPEEVRLKYRFLDLRREELHNKIILRSKIISELRNLMIEENFLEFQTPILTSSSPEGARNFLVPSRIHPGKFYALPQSPQLFKQLLMISGFDRYFQIAPCFRDEAYRSDRSPGEFYQLDIEMSFVTQEDIFSFMEPILRKVFTKFSNKAISAYPFPKIPYYEALLKYGTDKPDLRNPLIITDVTDIFKDTHFIPFKNNIEKGGVVRAILVPNAAYQSRNFFDKMTEFANAESAGGLSYIQFADSNTVKGSIVKLLTDRQLLSLKEYFNIQNGEAVFFYSSTEGQAAKFLGKLRNKLALDLNLLQKECFKFCWITDFPFYELNEETGLIDFSHNPFSMPKGGIEALENAKTPEELLAITAYQYDIVCNGIELSSGAIRNHKPEIMYKAFEIAGYSREEVDKNFGGMIKAFKYGAPPHGGIAPGIDRMVMLITDSINIKEVIAFPLNQKAEDLLMNAPNFVDEKYLKELHIILSPSVKNDSNKISTYKETSTDLLETTFSSASNASISDSEYGLKVPFLGDDSSLQS